MKIGRLTLTMFVVALVACSPDANHSRAFATNDPVDRACALDHSYLARIWRGYNARRSGDLLMVPLEPNYSGSFNIAGHSGPWDYLQRVPLVFYGPGQIKASGALRDDQVQIVDVYPTVGRLTGVDLPGRDGRVLKGALLNDRSEPPRLIITVVWDGAGLNVLERWPNRWPNLKRLYREGTAFVQATVGSSPSTTPTIHSSLGTGAWPSNHLVTGNFVRAKDGSVIETFQGANPQVLKLTTFADEIDRSLGNAPKVGTLGWLNWHLGMMGHGTAITGADADQFARVKDLVHGGWKHQSLYDSPAVPQGATDIDERLRALDRSDGRSDGRYLDHDVLLNDVKGTYPIYWNPAWVDFQTDYLIRLLAQEGYGDDGVPDLFFTNYKMTDLAGHAWTLDSEEVGSALEAQDAALGRLLEWLDANVEDHVIVVTSDHGHTPSPKKTGAWPIGQGKLVDDIEAHFQTPEGEPLVEKSDLVSLFLNEELMERLEVTIGDVARFINDYTIGQNWDEGELPGGYGGREDEHLFEAAFPAGALDRVMICAFGSRKPPTPVRG